MQRTLCVMDLARIYFDTFEIYVLMAVYQNNLYSSLIRTMLQLILAVADPNVTKI